MSQSQVRKAMDTYGERVTRASVPEAKHLQAAWGDFTIRTTDRLNQTVSRQEVSEIFTLFPSLTFQGGTLDTNFLDQLANLGILIIILTTKKYRTNSKFTNGITAPSEHWGKSVLSLLREVSTGFNLRWANIFTLIRLQSQFLGAESRRFNRTNKKSTQHNQTAPNVTTTMAKTIDMENNMGLTGKLLGGLIAIWILVGIIKLVANLLKTGFHHISPPGNNEEPDTPPNPYLAKLRPARTG